MRKTILLLALTVCTVVASHSQTDYFPLSTFDKAIWDPANVQFASFDATTGVFIATQYGFGGWKSATPIDLSAYKYLVMNFATDPSSTGASVRIFDSNNYWTTCGRATFVTAKQAVIDLTTVHKTNDDGSVDDGALNPATTYIVGVWTRGWSGVDGAITNAVTIKDCYVTNNDDYSKLATGTLNVYKLATAPTVDGILTDWGSNWIDLANTDTTSTTEGCTAQFQVGYTTDSLYIAVKVQDATEFTYDVTAVATYLRDCVEAFVHIDTTTIVTGFSSGSTQFRMQRVQDVYNADDANKVAANVVSVDNPDVSYAQEWAIAWTDIAAKESFDISNGIDALTIPYIRFDIKAADNTTGTDAGRTQQIFWSTTSDNEYTGMTQMGYLHLMGVANAVSKVAGNSTKVYYNANKDALTVSNYIGEVRIYNVVGKLVLNTKVNSSNELINLNSFNNGVYLVSGSGFSTKFIK